VDLGRHRLLGVHKPAANINARTAAEHDSMAFLQLLGCQCQSEVGVTLADDRDGTLGNPWG
jgi:hypothetical protein